MPIAADFSIDTSKNIRYNNTSTANYTVLDFHRWLQDAADDASVATADDFVDITSLTPSDKSYDTIITLINGYNIDDHAAQHLYEGSIIQDGGNVIYDGLQVLAPAGTSVEVIQNGAPITPNFWGTALNADATKGISHRFMVKVRNTTDIDGRRLIVQTRRWGNQFSEFLANGTSRGINVAALAANSDGNNTGIESTVETYTTITNVEGYQGLDADGNGSNEFYYSQWNRATYSINTLFERGKWLTAEPRTEDSSADTGSDFAVGNGTITAQGQSFANGVNATWLTQAKVYLKKTGSPTGTAVAKLYAHFGTFGSSSVPTGAALATSATVDVSKLTTTYALTEFGFTTAYKMTASTNYVIVVEYSGGTAVNYVQVRGLATTGTHAGNRASFAGTWTAAATDDMAFDVTTVGDLYGLPGNRFRGITHEITTDTPVGTFSAVEAVSWTGGTGRMLAINSTTAPTKMWIQLLTGVAPTDNQTITGGTSAATCLVNITVTERDVPEKSALPFLGASTGTSLVGSYGVGVKTTDLTASDKLLDLTNTQRVPPNNVTFTVNGLVSGEDYILVAPNNAGNIQFNQMTLNGALTLATVTSVVVNGAIPSDTPSTGTIRILRANGAYTKHSYTAWSGSTFTIASTDFSTNNAANGANLFISYIDKLATGTSASVTWVYASDRSLFIRARDGGATPIKTFESTATMGSSGGSVTIIRTSDA